MFWLIGLGVSRIPQCKYSRVAFSSGGVMHDDIIVAEEAFHHLREASWVRSLRIDMSKAYDKVEWLFSEKALRRMGFAEVWV